jgi:hypothetical protein
VNRQQIAYEYLNACQVQSFYEQHLTNALRLFCEDNEVISVSDDIRRAYDNLIIATLGQTTFEWLLWWQYDCDYGKNPKGFTINNQEYHEVTQLKFTELITQ